MIDTDMILYTVIPMFVYSHSDVYGLLNECVSHGEGQLGSKDARIPGMKTQVRPRERYIEVRVSSASVVVVIVVNLVMT